MQIQYAQNPSTYQAGACNIGPDEIARRRRAGLTGVAIAVVIAIGLIAIGAPWWMRLAMFPPLAGGLVSLEQARRHFCVGFAMAGIRNFGALGSPDKVADAADRSADRRSALILTGYMSAIAAVISVVVALLPI
ncbi:MAG: hypothetical protein ACSLFN_07395 [Candidatus Limnocylindrales bacterium]